jgi:hypothetical protein
LPALPATPSLSVRSIFVAASSSDVAARLLKGYRIDEHTDATVVANDAFRLTATADIHGDKRSMTFLFQPVTETQTVLHGLLQSNAATQSERLAVLRHHNRQMAAMTALAS